MEMVNVSKRHHHRDEEYQFKATHESLMINEETLIPQGRLQLRISKMLQLSWISLKVFTRSMQVDGRREDQVDVFIYVWEDRSCQK